MVFLVYVPAPASREQFVQYWSAFYDVEGDSALYTPYVGKQLTPEAVRHLFRWKNGSRLSARKEASVERNYIARLKELYLLPEATSAEVFLERFSEGGAIWRIFWLHCWQPRRYPIYDQHVHRSMSFIQTADREEIDLWSDRTKISAYLHRYLPFHEQFRQLDQRQVDRALWAFGKFIRQSPLPEISRKHSES